ncbi:hypothetical protein AVEN_84424-1 [Araneus ventricosus]|uniref:Uncharacterized protein n=1 Tax=Araneus ventricosus TaxID=182803 RepID=A0A4Y2KW89_ARAVE|nr:hypothetical protein AVEN_102509-1 [Araneus ventricosus]GBN06650.1 hypothetical protein AVEN_84424-1 [Araneus ventricosus]
MVAKVGEPDVAAASHPILIPIYCIRPERLLITAKTSESPRSGNQTWLLLVIPYLSLQNSLPNHKTHIAGKRLSMFVTLLPSSKTDVTAVSLHLTVISSPVGG